MKNVLTVASLLVSGLLVWYTLSVEEQHRAREEQQRTDYIEPLAAALRAAAPRILKEVESGGRISDLRPYVSDDIRQQLQAQSRYHDELHCFFTHHMQVIYLRHDGKQIQLEAGDAVLLTIQP